MIESFSVDARVSNWPFVYNSVVAYFSGMHIPHKDILGITIASEEVFANIIHHSYLNTGGNVEISVDYDCQKSLMIVRFKYGGSKFDPTDDYKTNIREPVGARKLGGLGIYIIKKFTDRIVYNYCNDRNILEIFKKVG